MVSTSNNSAPSTFCTSKTCGFWCTCTPGEPEPLPAYSALQNPDETSPAYTATENSTQSLQPTANNTARQTRAQTTADSGMTAVLGRTAPEYCNAHHTWYSLLLNESSEVRKAQYKARLPNQVSGLYTTLFKFRKELREFSSCFRYPKIDTKKFPLGESLFGIHAEARMGRECKEHAGNQCFCVAYFHMGNRFSCDWKPFATGKFTALKRGKDCEIHGGQECFCVVRPSVNEVVYSYDLKTGKRSRM